MVAGVIYGYPLRTACPCSTSVQAIGELVLELGHKDGKALPAGLVETFKLLCVMNGIL